MCEVVHAWCLENEISQGRFVICYSSFPFPFNICFFVLAKMELGVFKRTYKKMKKYIVVWLVWFKYNWQNVNCTQYFLFIYLALSYEMFLWALSPDRYSDSFHLEQVLSFKSTGILKHQTRKGPLCFSSQPASTSLTQNMHGDIILYQQPESDPVRIQSTQRGGPCAQLSHSLIPATWQRRV